nr:hypothetical protein OH837_48865 [Streptomyces canus]
MNDDTTRQDALQMSRDLISMAEQEQQQAEDPHTDLGDCIGIVAYSVWNAAWRQARGDQAPDPELLAQVDHLVDHDDFLTLALYRHNWRNVNEVLAAFRDAGLAGTSDVARFYTHVDHIPKASEGPRPERQLPEWCGECDGPEPGRRMVDVPVPPGEPRLVKWCPRCEPRSPEYQAG